MRQISKRRQSRGERDSGCRRGPAGQRVEEGTGMAEAPVDLGGDEASLWRSRGAGTRRTASCVPSGHAGRARDGHGAGAPVEVQRDEEIREREMQGRGNRRRGSRGAGLVVNGGRELLAPDSGASSWTGARAEAGSKVRKGAGELRTRR